MRCRGVCFPNAGDPGFRDAGELLCKLHYGDDSLKSLSGIGVWIWGMGLPVPTDRQRLGSSCTGERCPMEILPQPGDCKCPLAGGCRGGGGDNTAHEYAYLAGVLIQRGRHCSRNVQTAVCCPAGQPALVGSRPPEMRWWQLRTSLTKRYWPQPRRRWCRRCW